VYRIVEPNSDLNRNVLSVNAPTGQTIIFPENSLSTAFEMQVDILE
jgi:hypothetical protein